MGSIDSATRTVGGGDETDEFRVLITGFGVCK